MNSVEQPHFRFLVNQNVTLCKKEKYLAFIIISAISIIFIIVIIIAVDSFEAIIFGTDQICSLRKIWTEAEMVYSLAGIDQSPGLCCNVWERTYYITPDIITNAYVMPLHNRLNEKRNTTTKNHGMKRDSPPLVSNGLLVYWDKKTNQWKMIIRIQITVIRHKIRQSRARKPKEFEDPTTALHTKWSWVYFCHQCLPWCF